MHNYESMAVEDLSGASAVDVAAFVTESLQHILEDEQVNSSVTQGIESLLKALATADSES